MGYSLFVYVLVYVNILSLFKFWPVVILEILVYLIRLSVLTFSRMSAVVRFLITASL